MNKICPNCHKEYDSNNKFCPYCGAKNEIEQNITCPKCGFSYSSEYKFCPKCGAQNDNNKVVEPLSTKEKPIKKN